MGRERAVQALQRVQAKVVQLLLLALVSLLSPMKLGLLCQASKESWYCAHRTWSSTSMDRSTRHQGSSHQGIIRTQRGQSAILAAGMSPGDLGWLVRMPTALGASAKESSCPLSSMWRMSRRVWRQTPSAAWPATNPGRIQFRSVNLPMVRYQGTRAALGIFQRLAFGLVL